MNTSVTKALKEVLLDLFAYTPKREVYTDARKNGAAVGVKFVGLKLTDDELDQVRHEMEARGFTHHYSRMNAQGWTTGTRFCYSAPGVEIVKKPKQNKKTEQSAVSLGIENKAINKNEFRPICMKCLREQFEQARPILEAHGLNVVQIEDNPNFDYLVNNLGGTPGNISNIYPDTNFGRIVVDRWDLALFLNYCGIETKTTKDMSTPKMYEVHLRDIMKIHDIACDTWKEIIMNDYISKVHKLKLTFTFFQGDVDRMFQAATTSQVPVLEQVFGKPVKEIEWDKIKTGSKVKIKYSGEHCDGWRWDMQETVEVDVVFFGTKHYINSNGFNKGFHYDHYFTFHSHDDKTNKFVLFGSNDFDDCKNFVVEVIEY
jgi:hypothetical protein